MTDSSCIPGKEDDYSLCCTEFQPGATVTLERGSPASKVAVQAVADFAGITALAVADITTACRSIAADLDVPASELASADALEDRVARLGATCDLAVAAIYAVKARAKGKLTIVASAPVCEASARAKTACQAQCSGTATCDANATPLSCKGGKLEVSCKGACTGSSEAGVACTGTCEGDCKGTCLLADGTSTDGDAACVGSCNGRCAGTCKGTADVAVTCDGTCDGSFEPLHCNGGRLEGGCQADAKCDANCDASVSAKASCTPPSIRVSFTGQYDAVAAGKLASTLEANLGALLAFQARLRGMIDASSTFLSNVTAVVDIKVYCIPPVVRAAQAAVVEAEKSVAATTAVAQSVALD